MFIPLINLPEVVNPTVESTVTTLPPTPTLTITFLAPAILKFPCIKSLSLNPTNRETL